MVSSLVRWRANLVSQVYQFVRPNMFVGVYLLDMLVSRFSMVHLGITAVVGVLL